MSMPVPASCRKHLGPFRSSPAQVPLIYPFRASIMVQTFLIAAALLGSAIACPDHRGLWKRASEEADYDYQYPQGWGRLQEEYSPCFVGSQQAPLNLATNDGSCKHHTPTFNYSMQMHGNLENSGTSLSYTLSDTDDTTKLPSFIFQEKAHLDEEVYLIGWYVLARPRNIGAWCFNLITTKVLADKLYARHLHSPSEHTRDGSAAKAEMHFVHADAEGNARSVLGFLIQPSPGNGTQSKFFNHISQP